PRRVVACHSRGRFRFLRRGARKNRVEEAWQTKHIRAARDRAASARRLMTQPAEPPIAQRDAGERPTPPARSLVKTYKSGEVKIHALRGVNLELFARELVVLVGASGSGKSTLLNILGGLDVPTSGQVHFRGRGLTELNDAGLTLYRREHVGF